MTRMTGLLGLQSRKRLASHATYENILPQVSIEVSFLDQWAKTSLMIQAHNRKVEFVIVDLRCTNHVWLVPGTFRAVARLWGTTISVYRKSQPRFTSEDSSDNLVATFHYIVLLFKIYQSSPGKDFISDLVRYYTQTPLCDHILSATCPARKVARGFLRVISSANI